MSSQMVTRRRKMASASTARPRPHSECLSMQLADSLRLEPPPLRLAKASKERPKSDIGGSQISNSALAQYEQGDSITALPNLSNRTSEFLRMKPRRETHSLPVRAGYGSPVMNPKMSQPHPIKTRLERSPPSRCRLSWRKSLQRSLSAPDLLCPQKSNRRAAKTISYHGSTPAGDLAGFCCDDNISEDAMSLGTVSEASSSDSHGKQAILEEIFEESPLYVEALWDHVTLDSEELGFRAGDLIEVTDMSDKDWWWGQLEDREGWFPAPFVMLKAIQTVTADDLAQKVKEGEIDSQVALQCYSSTSLVSKEQARCNVVKEIIHVEKEYVRHLRDVVEGYVEKARKRPEMFNEEQIQTIFSNIESIYTFSRAFCQELEKHMVADAPSLSQFGEVFLQYRAGFSIYSKYCNDHPRACEELHRLQNDHKYQYFFEACRLLQQMMEIPLEGFLLIPVQKICKYPLQLGELLRYTRPDHPDFAPLSHAHAAMKEIAMMINERKRKMESVEKLAAWQNALEDFEGPDLLETSSELIYSGELTKVNASGWAQERMFFMFDHQLVYCKKDLLWRDVLIYKGRIDLDMCDVVPIRDGKDMQFNTTVRNAWKLHDRQKDKWYLLYSKTPAKRDRWIKAFNDERQRVVQDKLNGFSLSEYREMAAKLQGTPYPSIPEKNKAKHKRGSEQDTGYGREFIKGLPSHATLPRTQAARDAVRLRQTEQKSKKGTWHPFKSKKSKTNLLS